MKKVEQICSGKTKTLFTTDNDDFLICEFRNDTTAFNGEKAAQLDRKGIVNNQFSAHIMQVLEKKGITTHFEKIADSNSQIVKKLKMLRVECVVRNVAAGSICKRLGIEQGKKLTPPTFEFFLKDDGLGDPMINDSHIITFGWADQAAIDSMRQLSFKVNEVLFKLFDEANLILVDYKLEFGYFKNQLVLGDEFTPDGCRIWDKDTNKILDKDRFRQDLGDVVEAYEEVAQRLGAIDPITS